MEMKLKDKLTIAVVPALAHLIIRLIRLTMRLTYVNYSPYRSLVSDGKKVIIAFWHGRLLMMPYCYLGKKISILVSQSKDGELIARTIQGFGMDSVRGSTTRGWFAGIKGLLRAAQQGNDLAITPDGPKGPKWKVQMGAIQIAKATGLPIVPITFNASKKKHLAVGMAL
ncbi:MAG: lysophospholipid acyltransferase family protein [Deltaproteobacteria bacterium]|nr:lysophospholipid acyltransferase family protein [Deltaproteobacteria bacterium]